jgi:hypothetical protein
MLPALLSMAPGLMSAAGGLFGLFGNKKRANAPMNAANPYLNNIPSQMNPYYQPYMNAGNDALTKTKSEYDKLIGDPNAMYDKFAAGYKESPGYKSRLEEAMREITNAQAAGGMAGSMQHQQYSADKAMDLHSKDFEDYLNHVMGLYGAGLSGEQGIENQGYGANTDYANMLANITGQKANMAYGAKNQENENSANSWKNIFGGASSALSGYGDYSNHQDILKLLGNMGGH